MTRLSLFLGAWLLALPATPPARAQDTQSMPGALAGRHADLEDWWKELVLPARSPAWGWKLKVGMKLKIGLSDLGPGPHCAMCVWLCCEKQVWPGAVAVRGSITADEGYTRRTLGRAPPVPVCLGGSRGCGACPARSPVS